MAFHLNRSPANWLGFFMPETLIDAQLQILSFGVRVYYENCGVTRIDSLPFNIA